MREGAELVGLFVRVERRSAGAGTRPLATGRALAGAALVVLGLAFTAMGGVAAAGGAGVRLWAVAPPLLGAALADFGPLVRRGA